MIIESTSNKIIKHTRKLLDRSGRKEHGQFIIEGKRLVCDAIDCGADVKYVLLEEGCGIEFSKPVQVYEVTKKVFATLKATVNSQGIIGVVDLPDRKDFDVDLPENDMYIYLDGVADPGNMGTIIRTADACGAKGVILSQNCVDVYNPKVVRSTMASIFNVPLHFDDGERSILKKLKENNIDIISGSLQTDKSLYDIDFKSSCVIVIGNEANGISDEVIGMSTKLVKIPIIGKAESLNAAVACAVMAYERLRQNI